RGQAREGDDLRDPPWERRPRLPRDHVSTERGRNPPAAGGRARAAELLPAAGVPAAPDDPPRVWLEPPLRRHVPQPAGGRAAHLRPGQPAPRHARRLPRRRLDLPLDPAERPHLQPDGERGPRRDAAREAARMSARVAAVTGASGLIGRALSAHFAARGWEVRALVRDPAAFGPPPAGVRLGRCDLPDTLDETLLAGADAVLHAAYATRERDRERARRVNEDGTRRLLEASRRAGVPRFLFVSTVAAHPEAPNYYARSKYALESLCDPGRDLVVRPGLVLAREGHGI